MCEQSVLGLQRKKKNGLLCHGKDLQTDNICSKVTSALCNTTISFSASEIKKHRK